MEAWNRRLKDLSFLLENCEKTYFEPELFRMNANQFLQTSRTVTFLIQKNKKNIPTFDSWYSSAVIEPWGKDVVLTWAKDSRNKIEKQGDIAYHSSLMGTLIYSYYHREDISVFEPNDKNVLWLKVAGIIKYVKPKMTQEAFDNAVIRIERKWIANSLPDWELLHAFCYIYAQQYKVCNSLQSLLNDRSELGVPDPSEIDTRVRESKQIAYLSPKDGVLHRFHGFAVQRDPDFKADVEVTERVRSVEGNSGTLEGALASNVAFAEAIFEKTGQFFHSFLMYDESGNCIYYGGTEYSGLASKYMFWRMLGEQVVSLSPAVFVVTSESWLRDYRDKDPKILFRERPIVGEKLSVTVIDRHLDAAEVTWKIVRNHEGKAHLNGPEYCMDRSMVLRTNNIIAPVVEGFVVLIENRIVKKC